MEKSDGGNSVDFEPGLRHEFSKGPSNQHGAYRDNGMKDTIDPGPFDAHGTIDPMDMARPNISGLGPIKNGKGLKGIDLQPVNDL